MSAIAKQPVIEMAMQPKAPEPHGDGLLQMIERVALNPAADVTKLEKMIELRERIMRGEAEAAFNVAFSAAQKQIRAVAADAYNKQTSSRYATLDALDRALRPIYTENGFGMSYGTAEAPQGECVRVTCLVTHIAGHGRNYHIDMPNDGKGAKGGDVMTKTHATGAAVAYGMRYLLRMIWNVAVGEDDRDGNAPEPTRPQAQERTPDGYQDWLDDMAIKAEDGWSALSAAWNKSKADYRNHLTRTSRQTWESMRAKAEQVTKNGGRA